MQHHQGDGNLGDAASVEDRAESLRPEAESIFKDVRREKLVTQLAVHSASDDLPTWAWQAGDASLSNTSEGSQPTSRESRTP